MIMLPTFPTAQEILNEAWNKRMFAAKNEVFPHHMHPPVQQIHEGKSSDFQREDRQIRPLEMKLHSVTTQINTSSGQGLTLEVFNQKAQELGEGLGKQMWETITGAINEAVAETGNEVKFKKGNLKQEDMLRLLEMGEETFDENGNPNRQIVCGSEMMEEFKKVEEEWAQDKVFQDKVEEIRKRKKAAFNEREARRRLVD